MNRRSKVAPYHNMIVEMRAHKLSSTQMVDRIWSEQGVKITRTALRSYMARNEMTLKAPADGPLDGVLLLSVLSRCQRKALASMAEKWGCETLAEAALEILRDKLEEEMT